MKRYDLTYTPIYGSFTGDIERDEINGIKESLDGEFCKYEDVENLIYENKHLNNHLEWINNIPTEFKYIIDKDIDELTEEELSIHYKAIPAAKLKEIK